MPIQDQNPVGAVEPSGDSDTPSATTLQSAPYAGTDYARDIEAPGIGRVTGARPPALLVDPTMQL